MFNDFGKQIRMPGVATLIIFYFPKLSAMSFEMEANFEINV